MRTAAYLLLAFLPLPAWAAEAAPNSSPEGFSVTPGERQLFVDDVGIGRIENLQRTMHRPVKRGAVIRSPQPTENLQTRTAPVWDPGENLYKLWVLGIDDNLWLSRDGLNWNAGPPTSTRITMAVYDPRDPDPARRFKAPLLNRGFAVSPDGIAWTQLELPKIQSSDEGNFSYDPETGLFIHTVKRGGTFGRSLALATSPDFENWTDYGVVFQTDELDQELGKQHIAARMADETLQQTLYNDPSVYNVDVYNMGVFRYEGLYIGLPALYHATGPVPNYPNTVGFHLIQLAASRDLKTWQRLGDRQTFIGPSRKDSGAYDLTQILPPSTAIVRDDELWFYYTGLKHRGTFTYVGTYPNGEHVKMPGRSRDLGGVCLAVLRRDGFISLDADHSDGVLVTEPFDLPAGKLHVNVDATDGRLQVTLLDEQQDELATSASLVGDHTDAALDWERGNLSDFTGQRVRLQVTLKNASLYSYWLSD